ncbi:Mlo-related protein [Arabidopsis suecica]|uniref:MLO-like protein n=1 Tax=Arabidopsis suecica TaxID=45249 RepID=A0A8T2AQC7_ARASU|nr:Mlo-related protein [Arabidopsis suecica]
MAGGGTTLEYTPTWVVALVCSVIVSISFAVERLLHRAGKHFRKNDQKQLFGALQKVKEELMLLGFISLLLSVSQSKIAKICIPKDLSEKFLPCNKPKEDKSLKDTTHFQFSFTGRHLLAEDSATGEYCSQKGKAPLMSLSALHELHIFIFVLAVAHIIFCLLTILFGTMKIMQWRKWEDQVLEEDNNTDKVIQKKFTHVREHEFIRGRFLGVGKADACFGWLQSFMKQFLASVNKSDYITMRLGFVTTHCKTNPKFNFHKYLMRALNSDFKKVVGISWYLWVFVVLFLLLNIAAWHVYFWLAFIPLILLLAVGTKLEHIITDLAHEVAEKHIAVEGDLVVRPSDDLFWFQSPRLVLFLIHFILFQNSFELAYFFFILVTYGWDSCIMDHVKFIIPRLIIGVLVQLLCSYSTLPLYALVTQMGSSFKGAIFNEQTQQQIVGWARMAKKGVKKGTTHASTSHGGNPNPLAATPSPRSVQLQSLLGKGSSQQNQHLGETPEIVEEKD